MFYQGFSNNSRRGKNGHIYQTIPVVDHILLPEWAPRNAPDRPTPEISDKPKWQKSGWKVGAALAALTAGIALLINTGVMIWALKHGLFKNGFSAVYSGNCAKVETMNTWIHFGINALSTALLSGSNYCMQCASAPTRDELRKAHQRRVWLDIGVPSIRNLRNIKWRKVIIWWCLGISSVPLHLMYNSAFFAALETNEYEIIYAKESFLAGATYNKTEFSDSKLNLTAIQQRAGAWENLTNAECISAYANDFLNTRRNVILVVKDPPGNEGSLLRADPYDFADSIDPIYDPYSWICDFSEDDGRTCTNEIPQMIDHAKNGTWTTRNHQVRYCLSEAVEGTCTLNFSLTIIIIVITFNLVKLIVMCVVVFNINDKPLITVGDAVDSFLEERDPTTLGMCLATKVDIQSNRWVTKSAAIKFYQLRRAHWFRAASKRRWWTCLILFVLALGTIFFLLIYGIVGLKSTATASMSLLWSLGFGAVHPQSIITGWGLPSVNGSTIIAAVLVANSPQPILSFLYLIFNGLCTSMLLADEWSHFSTERKALRVSNPKGKQRSTYFLQLPYRFAIPLIILSGILHWLVSQSIFLANVSIKDSTGRSLDNSAISTCGYSPMAMIFVLITGGLLLLFAIGLGFRRYRPGIPLVGSCSIAISAACHPPLQEENARLKPLQWGALPSDQLDTPVGHCCFSSGTVWMPTVGWQYAGMARERKSDPAAMLGDLSGC